MLAEKMHLQPCISSNYRGISYIHWDYVFALESTHNKKNPLRRVEVEEISLLSQQMKVFKVGVKVKVYQCPHFQENKG